jgi:hypothetical protein
VSPLQLLAQPREWLLPRLPTPIPSPPMFTLDYIRQLEEDQVVPPNCEDPHPAAPSHARNICLSVLISSNTDSIEHGKEAQLPNIPSVD